MKKLLALILTIGMVFSLAACGGDKTGKDEADQKMKEETETKEETKEDTKEETEKLDYANMTEDDLIKEFINDENNITLDEFLKLVSTYSYATINDNLSLTKTLPTRLLKS